MCQARKMNIHVFVLGVSFYDIAIGEEFEDIKGVIRIRIYRRKIDNTMTKRRSTKRQTMIHKNYTLKTKYHTVGTFPKSPGL
jgi:hypothetical protein